MVSDQFVCPRRPAAGREFGALIALRRPAFGSVGGLTGGVCNEHATPARVFAVLDQRFTLTGVVGAGRASGSRGSPAGVPATTTVLHIECIGVRNRRLGSAARPRCWGMGEDLTLVAGIVAGADSIADMDLLCQWRNAVVVRWSAGALGARHVSADVPLRACAPTRRGRRRALGRPGQARPDRHHRQLGRGRLNSQYLRPAREVAVTDDLTLCCECGQMSFRNRPRYARCQKYWPSSLSHTNLSLRLRADMSQ